MSNNILVQDTISLKAIFSYDENGYLLDEQIINILSKYSLPDVLIKYYLDSHDCIKNGSKIDTYRIRPELDKLAAETNSGYEETILMNFKFDNIYHLTWRMALLAIAKRNAEIEADYPLNTLIKRGEIEDLLDIQKNIQQGISDLKSQLANSTELQVYSEKRKMLQNEALNSLNEGKSSNEVGDIFNEAHSDLKSLLNYEESISFLLGYLMLVNSEIDNYVGKVNTSIQVVNQALKTEIATVLI